MDASKFLTCELDPVLFWRVLWLLKTCEVYGSLNGATLSKSANPFTNPSQAEVRQPSFDIPLGIGIYGVCWNS